MKIGEKIGEFLIEIQAMTAEQRDDVLSHQAKGDTRLFGEIARELGYVDKKAIDKFLSISRSM